MNGMNHGKGQPKINIAVFASGAGSNAEKLIQYFKDSDLATVALIVCNKPGAGVLAIAEKESVPSLLIEKENFFRGDGYIPYLRDRNIHFIVLAGFLWKIPPALVEAYPKRIVNIHPALLPKYGGKGMYGQYVHEAVLNAGEMESGITIHYVDEHYDNGDIVFQTACPILPGDKPGDIAQRIHQLEHAHYPRVIEEILRREEGTTKKEGTD
jgi:phosphoribosylglycinamide formyltransferase-1